MKTVVFVESNGIGRDAYRLAKERGLRTVFVTRDVDHYRREPGMVAVLESFVDDVVTAETNDVAAVTALVDDLGRRHTVVGALTYGEYHIPVAAEAARRLGLPGLDPDAARAVRNKLGTRMRCVAAGVPVPRFRAVATAGEARAAVADVGLPCVVKPTDGAASRDVRLCRTAAEAVEQVAAIRAVPHTPRGQPRFPQALVEEYLTGIEVSLEVVSFDDRIVVTGVTDKLVSPAPYFVEVGHSFPSCLPEDVLDDCRAVGTAALRAVGFDCGVSHVEVKVTGEGARLIEINGRPAGDRITVLVEQATGISLVAAHLSAHLGEEPDLTATVQAGAAIRFLTAPPGRVQNVAGVDLARRLPGVVDVAVGVRPGDDVGPLHSSAERCGHVMGVAATAGQAALVAEAAAREITVDTGAVISGRQR